MPSPNLNDNNKKVAVVTGSNRGIGLQIVKDLSQKLQSNYDVLLTSRNEERGQDAIKQVAGGVAAVKFHQLDIDNHTSIDNLGIDLKKTYGGVDILVQNGAILLSHSKDSIGEIAETTMKTNYFSVRDLCRTLLPIMHENGRVVLLAGRAGDLPQVKCAKTRQRLLSNDLKGEELDKIMQNFVDEAKARSSGQQQESQISSDQMWADSAFQQPYGAYRVSKIGVVALARVLQREADALKKNILVTSVCPGYVDTDMTDHQGEKTVAEGADTPVYLAMVKEGGESAKLKGQFFGERQVIDWENFKAWDCSQEELRKRATRTTRNVSERE